MHQKLRLVSAKAGDLVLWDSRTIHANTPALEKPVNRPDDELLRAVSYVCMTPKHLANEAVLQARRNAFDKRIARGHWPHLMPSGSYSTASDDVGAVSQLAKTSSEVRKLVG